MWTIKELRVSSLKARPKPNEAGKINIIDMNPLLSNKTLTIRGQARGSNGENYNLNLIFYGVEYSLTQTSTHVLNVRTRTDQIFYAKQLREDKHHVQIRCNCKDHYFMWHWWNKQNKILLGKLPPKYIRKTTTYPERNPQKIPGVCKHLIALFNRLKKDKILV